VAAVAKEALVSTTSRVAGALVGALVSMVSMAACAQQAVARGEGCIVLVLVLGFVHALVLVLGFVYALVLVLGFVDALVLVLGFVYALVLVLIVRSRVLVRLGSVFACVFCAGARDRS
jgi:hypothetical protein